MRWSIDPPPDDDHLWAPEPCILCGLSSCGHTLEEQREEWAHIEKVTREIKQLIDDTERRLPF